MNAMQTKLIIPAAGFGTRIGSPEAKELIISPITGKPMIDLALTEAEKRGWLVHVITRSEKKGLITYLEKFPFVTIQIVTPTKEWPDTILTSKEYWSDHNFLILPDTHFSPLEILDDMAEYLCCYQAVYACFETHNLATWGAVSTLNKKLQLIEKPRSSGSREKFKAWGIIGFQRDVGEQLFLAHLKSTFTHEVELLEINTKEVALSSFKDLTR